MKISIANVSHLTAAIIVFGSLATEVNAALTLTISKNALGEAVIAASGSGSTVSTLDGDWHSTDRASGSYGNVQDFVKAAASNFRNSPVYANNDFRLSAGISISAGSDTRFLDRFEFEDGGGGPGRDDWSLAFGNGTSATPWNTTTTSVGTIAVNDTSFHRLLINGNPIQYDTYFIDGVVVSQPTAGANNFWGGITLLTNGAAVPEPSSILLLGLGLVTGVVKRRRS